MSLAETLVTADDVLVRVKVLGGAPGPAGADGAQGVDGAPGEGIKVVGTVANIAALPDPATYGGESGDIYITANDGHGHSYDSVGFSWTDVGELRGPAGADGIDGADGVNGVDGLAGAPGADGLDGAPGPAGANGADGVDGLPGADGAQGPPGNDGADGLDGTGIEIVGSVANAAALPDPNLYAGSNGDVYITDDNGHGHSFENVTPSWVDIGELRGPIGPAGADGVDGVDGVNGADGAQGIQGIQGDVGPQGIQGIQGIAGADGAVGADGLDGADGAQGIQGIQGIQGDAGADGLDGADGAQGIQGIQGIQGDAGADGNDGAQGLQGIQGVQGDAGADGVDGTNGINGADGIDGADAYTPPVHVAGTAYTLALADNTKTIVFDNAALVTVTIPTEATLDLDPTDAGYYVPLRANGAAGLTLAIAGVTAPGFKTIAQYETLVLEKDPVAVNTWIVHGGTSA